MFQFLKLYEDSSGDTLVQRVMEKIASFRTTPASVRRILYRIAVVKFVWDKGICKYVAAERGRK